LSLRSFKQRGTGAHEVIHTEFPFCDSDCHPDDGGNLCRCKLKSSCYCAANSYKHCHPGSRFYPSEKPCCGEYSRVASSGSADERRSCGEHARMARPGSAHQWCRHSRMACARPSDQWRCRSEHSCLARPSSAHQWCRHARLAGSRTSDQWRRCGEHARMARSSSTHQWCRHARLASACSTHQRVSYAASTLCYTDPGSSLSRLGESL
jgi:hypothetical protein